MRRIRFISLILLSCVTATASGHDDKEARKIDRLAWLQGRWENLRPLMVTEETWLPAIGNTMLGVSRVVKSDSLIAHEVIIIREHGTRFAYEARPSGQETATFFSVSVSDSSVVFENLQHDFPQRIGYQRIGADSLYAWIEGTVRGKTKRNEFPYWRAR